LAAYLASVFFSLELAFLHIGMWVENRRLGRRWQSWYMFCSASGFLFALFSYAEGSLGRLTKTPIEAHIVNDDGAFGLFLSDASALVALGAVAGPLIGLAFHLSMSESHLALWGSVIGFVFTLFWKIIDRKPRIDLLRSLADANALFISGVIDEYEWRIFRLTGIQVVAKTER
jgi:hypothetical protein